MPRKNPQDLAGSTRRTPIASQVDTFAVTDPSALVAPVPKTLLDLSEFSNVLARVVKDRDTDLDVEVERLAQEIGEKVAQGEDLNTLLKEVSEAGSTPRAVASRLAKMTRSGSIEPTSNPFFLKGYQEGQAKVRGVNLRRKLDGKMNDIRAAGQKAAATGEDIDDAMLNAARVALFEDEDVFEGMGFYGRSVLQNELTRTIGDALNIAHSQVQDSVLADAAAGVGARFTESLEQYAAADAIMLGPQIAGQFLTGLDLGEDVTPEALRSGIIKQLSDMYTDEMRLAGWADHEEKLTEFVLTAGAHLKDKFGGDAAADAMEAVLDDLRDGTSRKFDDASYRTAKIQRAADEFRKDAKQDEEDLDKERRQKQNEGKAKVRADGDFGTTAYGNARRGTLAEFGTFIRNAEAAALEKYADDPELLTGALAQIDEWRSDGIQAQREDDTFNSEAKADIIQSLFSGDIVLARERLNRARNTISAADFEKLSSELDLAEAGTWIYEGEYDKKLATELRIQLSNSPLFQLPEGGGPDEVRIFGAVNRAVYDETNPDSFYSQVLGFIAEGGENLAEATKRRKFNVWKTSWLKGTVEEYTPTSTTSESIIEQGAAVLPRVEQTNKFMSEDVKAYNDIVHSVTTHGMGRSSGVTVADAGVWGPYEKAEDMDPVTVEIARQVRRVKDYLVPSTALFGRVERNYHGMILAPKLNKFLRSDIRGLPQDEKEAWALKAVASLSHNTVENVLQGTISKETLDKLGVEQFSELNSMFDGVLDGNKRLDYSYVDIFGTLFSDIIEEELQKYVETTRIGDDFLVSGISAQALNDPGIHKIQDLLTLYGYSSDGLQVARFLKTQHEMYRTLYPKEAK